MLQMGSIDHSLERDDAQFTANVFDSMKANDMERCTRVSIPTSRSTRPRRVGQGVDTGLTQEEHFMCCLCAVFMAHA